ncbi:class C sortase [Lacticaseibacillus manihotivorans]|jgi:sortase A|uniref:Sortase n=2 Tax=Lacticaseibacillus manihotivorans TaxID=88233 RepID=A0A0R1QH90_9LACO|nr:class C sortase [Lacticaseibacillus manihotivorans]KRL43921.1 sortase [Lacticaseibacillus manihotivorans DSM 13343 = JCM 12514]QFQ90670.1 class C sortase [Lacticaseibacillus manihotivorans]
MRKHAKLISRLLLVIMIGCVAALVALGVHYVVPQYETYQQQKAAIASLDKSGSRAMAKAQSAKGTASTVDVQQTEATTIGAVIIPKIKVELPVFSNSSTSALDVGAGWLPQSSPLGGGESTHAVIDGHSGKILSLFTRIRELKKGDPIYIKVKSQTLEYKVTSKSTHSPTYVKDLVPKHGEDLLTLITCTPIYLNTHRLHVTAKRVPFDGKVSGVKTWIQWIFDHPLQVLGSVLIGLVMLISVIWWIVQHRANDSRKERRIQ